MANKKRKVSVGTTFVAEDVMSVAEARGEEMSKAEAEQFLRENFSVIQDRLTELGFEIIDTLL